LTQLPGSPHDYGSPFRPPLDELPGRPGSSSVPEPSRQLHLPRSFAPSASPFPSTPVARSPRVDPLLVFRPPEDAP
jgi:hypothetical protein